jgi:hypothetical protein
MGFLRGFNWTNFRKDFRPPRGETFLSSRLSQDTTPLSGFSLGILALPTKTTPGLCYSRGRRQRNE